MDQLPSFFGQVGQHGVQLSTRMVEWYGGPAPVLPSVGPRWFAYHQPGEPQIKSAGTLRARGEVLYQRDARTLYATQGGMFLVAESGGVAYLEAVHRAPVPAGWTPPQLFDELERLADFAQGG